jgi:hypothetical protein
MLLDERLAIQPELEFVATLPAGGPAAQPASKTDAMQLGERTIAAAERPIRNGLVADFGKTGADRQQTLVQRVERAAAFPQLETIGLGQSMHPGNSR